MNEVASEIIRCRSCGAKNRIPAERPKVEAKCGKCGSHLEAQGKDPDSASAYTIRCLECRTKNRIPAAKIDAGAKCGKCGVPLKADELFVPQPVMVTDSNFDDVVLNSPLPVLLLCWAAWCPTCGAVVPIIDELARDTKGKIRVGKLNVDSNPTTAAKFNVLSVPFIFIFDNGQLKESMPGGLQKHELMMKMAQYL
ncbi:MAG: thioredoxin domain-containing protein [Desulfobacterales bacterium]|jgi:thioredoxin 2